MIAYASIPERMAKDIKTACALAKPGDIIYLETIPEVNVDQVAGMLRIESDKMIAKINGKKVCTIGSVAIAAFSPGV